MVWSHPTLVAVCVDATAEVLQQMTALPDHGACQPDPGQTDALGYSRTNWSMIMDAASESTTVSATALDRVIQRYWPAVFGFIRSSGKSADEASDLTQGFLCDVLLGRNLLQTATPERGRFRSLLLKSVSNYVREQQPPRHAKEACASYCRWQGVAVTILPRRGGGSLVGHQPGPGSGSGISCPVGRLTGQAGS